MQKNTANVLMLSYDNTLLEEKGGETYARLNGHSQYVSRLFVFVPNTKIDSFTKVNEKLTIVGVGGIAFLRPFKLVMKAIQYGVKNEVDLIVTSDPVIGFLGLITKFFLRRPKLNINVFALEIVDPEWVKQASLKARLYKWFSIVALKNADSIRSDSNRAIASLKSLGVSCRMIVVPIVPTAETFRDLTHRDSKKKTLVELPGLIPEDDLVLTIGYLIPQKDHETLIKVAKEVIGQFPRTKFVIIGSGPLKNHLRSLINLYGLNNNVYLVEAKPMADLVNYYHRATIFVISSLFEGGPRVVVEAALAGKPIISTDVGSVRDLIVDQFSGIIVPTRDIESLSRAISKLLADKVKQELFSKRLKLSAIKYYQANSNLQKITDFWYETINR